MKFFLVRCLSFDKEKCRDSECFWSLTYSSAEDGTYSRYPQECWDGPFPGLNDKIDENRNRIMCDRYSRFVIIKKYSTKLELYMDKIIEEHEENEK